MVWRSIGSASSRSTDARRRENAAVSGMADLEKSVAEFANRVSRNTSWATRMLACNGLICPIPAEPVVSHLSCRRGRSAVLRWMATNEHGEDIYPVPVARRPLPPALLFGRTFLRHPRMLGSVVPSSRFPISRVLRQADWGRTKVVMEAGPGVGTLTGPILDRLG